MIAGTTIGAGMLGIPLVTAKYGFLVATAVTCAVWLFMLFTGLLLLEASIMLPEGANFLSISRKYLGKSGQWLTGFLFIFLYYFLMVAYIAAGGPLLGYFLTLVSGVSLTTFSSLALFAILFGSIVAIGPRSIDTVNFCFSIVMLVFLFLLFVFGARSISLENLSTFHLGPFFLAMPILFSAFGYHNIIPSLVTYLDKNVRVIRLAIIIGTAIPLVIYLLWQALIIGAVPLEVIQETLLKGQPVTASLTKIAGHPFMALFANLFGLFAIITSVLGVSFSLVDFLADGFKVRNRGWNRIFTTMLTFFPPLVCALVNPAIFDRALSIAGGIGESLINGMIPIALVYVLRYVHEHTSLYTFFGEKKTLATLFLFAVFVFLIEGISLII